VAGDIEAFLRLVLTADGTHELRVATAKLGPDGKPVYDYQHFGFGKFREMAEAAVDWSEHKGAVNTSIVFNPLKKDVPSYAAKKDVTSRRHIVIDVDPKRPAGVPAFTPATNAEKEQARLVMEQVRAFLRERGWPEPLVVDSGNGWHLWYRVALENDREAYDLIHRVLLALDQRFGIKGRVEIDANARNAARTMRLPGTMSRKGPHTEERPHRRSRLVSRPDVYAIVPDEKLQELAAEAKVPGKTAKGPGAAQAPGAVLSAADSPTCCGACPGGKLKTSVSPDSPYYKRIEEFLAWAVREWPSIDGDHGSDNLMKTAAGVVRGLCTEPAAALPFLRTWNVANAAAHETTLWSEKELVQALNKALTSSPRPWGYMLADSQPRTSAPAPEAAPKAPLVPITLAPPIAVTPEDPLTELFREQFGRQPSLYLPEPVKIDQLVAPVLEQRLWILQDLLPRKAKGLLAGREKGGKTTLLAHGLAGMSRGDKEFLGFALEAVPTLIVTQEPQEVWMVRQGLYNFNPDLVHFQPGNHGLARPYLAKPSLHQWEDLNLRLAQRVQKYGYGLVIIDHLATFWSVKNERDEGEVEAAWAPVNLITHAGATALALHHANKFGGIRGSTAVAAYPDHVLEFRRVDGSKLDTKRALSVHSRYLPATFDLTLNLDFSRNPPVGVYELKDDTRVNTQAKAAGWLAKIPTWPPVARVDFERQHGVANSTLRHYLDRLQKGSVCFTTCGKVYLWRPTPEHPCSIKPDCSQLTAAT
jgi:hypothetical protein